MKTHFKGTNNRTVCGNTMTRLTSLSEDELKVDCGRCISRTFRNVPLFIRYKEAVSVLDELAELIEGIRQGTYEPDSFTLQPYYMFKKKIK